MASSEITILDDYPIIITKDKKWVLENKLVPGSILYLPDDAVLLAAPKEKE